MEGANWSKQVLILGKKIYQQAILLKEPNDNEKIIVLGKDDLNQEIILFEIHRAEETCDYQKKQC